MQPQQENEFVAYLTAIIGRTREGKMTWSQHNPTTYIWRPNPQQDTRLVIQRTSTNPITYSFQAIDQSNVSQMSVQNSGTPSNQTLHQLFTTIESVRDQKSLAFLKSILPSS